MALQVIGAGFGRTGTYSLKLALERLGYGSSYHMVEVFEHPEDAAVWQSAARGEQVDWDALFEGYGAGVDWPVAAFWRDLMDYYPEAKLILTVRDPVRWYESASKTIFAEMLREDLPYIPPAVRQVRDMIQEIIVAKGFGGNLSDRDHMINVFNRHNEEVQNGVPADRLLVFDSAQGWAPLCEFLEQPIPQEAYPRTNTSEEFIASSENWESDEATGGQAQP